MLTSLNVFAFDLDGGDKTGGEVIDSKIENSPEWIAFFEPYGVVPDEWINRKGTNYQGAVINDGSKEEKLTEGNGTSILVYGNVYENSKVSEDLKGLAPHGFWATGDDHSDFKGFNSPVEGSRPAYFGYSQFKASYHNEHYPSNYRDTGNWSKKNWISPEKYSRYRSVGDTDIRDSVIDDYGIGTMAERVEGEKLEKYKAWLVELFNTHMPESAGKSDQAKIIYIEKNLIPISLPNEYSQGVWVGWHQWTSRDGSARITKKTFLLDPEIKLDEPMATSNDIGVKTLDVDLGLSEFPTPGEIYTATGTINVTNDYVGDITYRWQVDGASASEAIYVKTADLKADESFDVEPYQVEFPSSDSVLELRILDPISTEGFVNELNVDPDNDFFEFSFEGVKEELFNLIAEDIEASIIQNEDSARVTALIKVKNDSVDIQSYATTLILKTTEGKTLGTITNVALGPKESRTYTFNFNYDTQAPVRILGEINPNKDIQAETTYADNVTRPVSLEFGDGICFDESLSFLSSRSYDTELEKVLYQWEHHKYTKSSRHSVGEPREDGSRRKCTHVWITSIFDGWRQKSSESIDFTFEESKQIEKVEFRSKSTDWEWEEATGSPNPVKAGYGFELRVTTRYSNSFELPPNESGDAEKYTRDGTLRRSCRSSYSGLKDGYYQSEYRYEGSIDIIDDACLRIIMPDGEELEHYAGASADLEMTDSNGGIQDRTRVYEIEMKDAMRLGIQRDRRYYIDETVKNGIYDITIETDYSGEISSEASDGKPQLADRKVIKIDVYGSHKDDLILHRLQ